MDRVTMMKDHLSHALVLYEETPQSLLATLNRPKVLNALSRELLLDLHSTLNRLGSRTLIIQGNGKAFCAGGDVVYLSSHPEAAPAFFQAEFSLFYRIHQKENFSVSVMKGATMGGGAGLSAACKARVATQTTLWAFPETVIGFVPDVGSNYLLPRLGSKAIGLYLALTGDRLNGADCFHLGIATHYVEESKLPELVLALKDSPNPAEVLASFHTPPDSSLCSVLKQQSIIRELFTNIATIEELFSHLSQHSSEWAKKTLSTLQFMCPLSLKVELRNFELGTSQTYGEVLDHEYNVAVRMTSVHNANFLTGITTRLVRKDKARPAWTPAHVTEVSEEMVAACLTNPEGPHLCTSLIRE
jgi:enoyl-CoA hydratase/carnithine racemase